MGIPPSRHELILCTLHWLTLMPICRDFERDFTKLLVGFLPSWTAPRGYRGRELVKKAFEAYFMREGQKIGSRLVQERYEVAVRNQLSLPDTAKLEASMAIGILGTTAPASFWMASHTLSTLLSAVFPFFLRLSLHSQYLHLSYEPLISSIHNPIFKSKLTNIT